MMVVGTVLIAVFSPFLITQITNPCSGYFCPIFTITQFDIYFSFFVFIGVLAGIITLVAGSIIFFLNRRKTRILGSKGTL